MKLSKLHMIDLIETFQKVFWICSTITTSIFIENTCQIYHRLQIVNCQTILGNCANVIYSKYSKNITFRKCMYLFVKKSNPDKHYQITIYKGIQTYLDISSAKLHH